jgi:hypothetical protein
MHPSDGLAERSLPSISSRLAESSRNVRRRMGVVTVFIVKMLSDVSPLVSRKIPL